MAIVGDGWLRTQGDEFYAYSRPSAIIMDEDSGETLEDALQGYSFKQIFAGIKDLSDRLERQNNLIADLMQNSIKLSTSSGIFSITPLRLQEMLRIAVVDPSTMYAFVDSDDDVNYVTIMVRWLDSAGVEVSKDILYGKVGDSVDYTFHKTIIKDGIKHQYPSSIPVIDETLNQVARNVVEEKVYFVKNQILTLTEV